MAKEQRQVPRFGERLRTLRGKRSLESVSLALREAGLARFGKSSLKRYEDGRVPDVTALWAMAVLYKRAPSDLLRELGEEVGLDVGKLATAGQLVTDAPDEAPVALDAGESAWLEVWRGLGAAQRRAATRVVLALTEVSDEETGRPPSKQAKRRSAS